jgi:hypothetical protein
VAGRQGRPWRTERTFCRASKQACAGATGMPGAIDGGWGGTAGGAGQPSGRPAIAAGSADGVELPVKVRAQREVVLTGLDRVVVAWS